MNRYSRFIVVAVGILALGVLLGFAMLGAACGERLSRPTVFGD